MPAIPQECQPAGRNSALGKSPLLRYSLPSQKAKLMPTLDFKGKSFVYTHHLSVPFRELVVDAKKSELTRQGVEFCQLPYAIHRIMGD